MHNAPTIRELTPDDVEHYLGLRVQALRDHPDAFGMDADAEAARPIEMQRGRLVATAESYVLGAWHGSDLIGMVGFRRETGVKQRHCGTIWGMYVATAWRGLGIGRRLLETAIVRARACDGLEQIELAVAIGNDSARGLYERLGFRVWGIQPRALKLPERYVDEAHMLLTLES